MSCLKEISAGGPGRVAALAGGGETVIGRTGDCAIRLDDGRVSRRHCVIFAGQAGFLVRDLGSANGTFLNGQRVVEAGLRDGDRLRVGFTELEFRAGDQPGGDHTTVVAPATAPTEPMIRPPPPRRRARARAWPVEFCTRCSGSVEPAALASGRARKIDGEIFCAECLESESTRLRAVAARRLPEAQAAPAVAAAPAIRAAPRQVAKTRTAPALAAGEQPASASAVAAAKRSVARRPAATVGRQVWAWASLALTVLVLAICAGQMPGAWLNFQRLWSPAGFGVQTVAPTSAERGFFGVSMNCTLKADDGSEVETTQSAGMIARFQYDDAVRRAGATGGTAKFDIIYDKQNLRRSALRDELLGIPTLAIVLLMLLWGAREVWQITKLYRRAAPAAVRARD